MRLLRFGKKGEERPGLLDPDGKIRDLGGVIDDLRPLTLKQSTFSRHWTLGLCLWSMKACA